MGSALDKETSPSHAQQGDWKLPNFNPCEPCPAGRAGRALKNDKNRAPSVLFDKDATQGSFNLSKLNRLGVNTPESRSMSPHVKSEQPSSKSDNSTNGEFSDWSESSSEQLESAVKAIAIKFGVLTPRYKELSTCYHDGKFATAEDEAFWLQVSQRVRNRTAQACYLKYKELHGSNVVRFMVPRSCGARHRNGGGTQAAKAVLAAQEAKAGARQARRHNNGFL